MYPQIMQTSYISISEGPTESTLCVLLLNMITPRFFVSLFYYIINYFAKKDVHSCEKTANLFFLIMNLIRSITSRTNLIKRDFRIFC